MKLKRRGLLIVGFLGMLLIMGCGDTARKQILGEWRVASVECDGKPDALFVSVAQTFTFTDDGYLTIEQKAIKEWEKIKPYQLIYSYKIGPGNNIDFVLPQRHSQNFVYRGIFSLDGDSLRVCWVDPGNVPKAPRPTDFTTTVGDRRMLWVLNRAKPKH